MPHAHLPRRHTPLALLADHPLQLGITIPSLAANPAILHLGEVALEKVDLVLAVHAGRVRAVARHAEVIEDLAAVDGRRGLRDQLDTPHGLSVPVRGGVEREARALRGDGVGGIFVGGGERDVFVDGLGAVDVVLVRPNLVAPRPGVEVCGCFETVLVAVSSFTILYCSKYGPQYAYLFALLRKIQAGLIRHVRYSRVEAAVPEDGSLQERGQTGDKKGV